MDPQSDLEQKLKERFDQLPKPVQDAITSSDVSTRLRSLADSHKLHFDQWQTFENEVMLAILGFQQVEDLQGNIAQHVGIAPDIAHALVEDVNVVVFEPIRQALEEGLGSRENAPTREMNIAQPQVPLAPTVQPATPPPSAPDIKVTRPSDGTYRPGEASAARKSVADDPYREPIG